MITFNTTFLSQEFALLGLRFSKAYSFDEQGNEGPTVYTITLGLIFFSVGLSYINLSEES